MPTNLTKSGYIFSGWNTNSIGTGTTKTSTTAVNENDIWYAVWTSPINITVIRNSSYGGTVTGSGTYAPELFMQTLLAILQMYRQIFMQHGR
ncbi:MAG: InlB B-repeat-containing protein [Clostridia bacterium]|nr:InlB B-repeat-containing protein [Clostridia bacterium]